MAKYGGYNPSITPNTANDNWSLVGASSHLGRVIEFSWGGEVTTTTAMHTRVARSTSGTSAVAGNVAKLMHYAAANALTFVTSWSAQPTLDSGDLFSIGWNAHGGVVRWLANPGEEFWVVGAVQISCRNSVGTAQSSYGVIWDEDA